MAKQFKPTWESVKTHALPGWYDACKVGIFIHWGLYSVPGWAQPTWELGEEPSTQEWYKHHPYAEWYQNSLRISGSATQEYHEKTYGKDFPYANFTDSFTCENFDPAQWARTFKQAGAGYVVLTSKHHDGFCLYPSKYTAFNSVNLGPRRDLVGELTNAVRQEGLKMGLYYSGLLDWTRYPYAHEGEDEFAREYDITYGFADYSFKQAMEIVDLYKPALLWNDIGWPEKGWQDLPYLFAHYYNSVPDGVVNDRYSGLWQDFLTAEYKAGNRSLTKKWEMCRGLGLSFGYNRCEGEEIMMSAAQLIRLLIQCVSQGGNLLINIGPMADGSIPKGQLSRLAALGDWLKEHSEAIYGTTLWQDRQEDDLGSGVTAYYTRRGSDLFVLLDGLTQGTHGIKLPFMQERVQAICDGRSATHIKLGNFFKS